ncbi:MAG: hypothetical protein ABFR95_09145 [Actinomycetota bacterium]
MEISACPACGTDDIRLEVARKNAHPLTSWRSDDGKPVFVASTDVIESSEHRRIVCVNGHAHPDRIPFEVEWSEPDGGFDPG